MLAVKSIHEMSMLWVTVCNRLMTTPLPTPARPRERCDRWGRSEEIHFSYQDKIPRTIHILSAN